MLQQIVPSRFRKRSKGGTWAAAAAPPRSSRPDTHRDISTLGRINIVTGSGSGDGRGTATISTLTNDLQNTYSGKLKAVGVASSTLTANDSLHQEDNNTNGADQRSVTSSLEPTYNGKIEAVGIDHLSLREQMWYKTQLHLLEKQKREATSSPHKRRHDGGGRRRLSSRYESSDRSKDDRYAAGINSHRDSNRNSPQGVDEFANIDSKKEVRFRSDTDPSPTKRSLMDDTLSSSMSRDVDTSDSVFDDVTLESTSQDGTETIMSNSYLTSVADDATFTSYRYEMVDDNDGKRRRRYQLGVGQTTKGRSKGPPDKDVSTKSRRFRRMRSAADDSDVGGETVVVDDDETVVVCPLIPTILEETAGWFEDTKSAINQVWYAFFISGDDIDRMADKLRDAKLELVERYIEQASERRDRFS